MTASTSPADPLTQTEAPTASAASFLGAAEEVLEAWEDAARLGIVTDLMVAIEKAHQLQQQRQQLLQQPAELQEEVKGLLLPDSIHFRDDRGNTALHYAAANGHQELVIFLLDKGARLEKNHSGNTALHWLVLNKQKTLLQLMMQEETRQRSSCGIHRLLPTSDKRSDETTATATRATATTADTRSEECSCALRIDVLQQNEFGKSALSEAFTAGDADVLQLLLEHHSAEQLEKETLKQPQEPLVAAPTASATATTAPEDQQQAERGAAATKKPVASSSAAISSVTHRLEFGDCHITCREVALDWKGEVFTTAKKAQQDDTTGVALWGAAVIGAQWLADLSKQNPAIFAGKNILELGAGCGLMGLVCAAMQPPPLGVSFADVFPATLENLRHNCLLNNLSLNQKPQEGGVAGEVLHLDWCDSSSWPKDECGASKSYDIIVASDLIYESSAVSPLVTVICQLLKPKIGRLYYTHRLSRDGASLFADSLRRANLKVEELSAPESYFQNCLPGKSDREFFLLFGELESESDFVLVRAAWR